MSRYTNPASKSEITDDAYLERYILYIYRFQSEHLYDIRDLNSLHIAITEPLAKIFGFSSNKEVIGLKYEDFPCEISQFAELLYAQDKQICQMRSAFTTLNVFECSNETAVLKCKVEPIINPYSRNLLGFSSHYTKFSTNSALQIIFNIHKFPHEHNKKEHLKAQNLSLTKTEIEVLFCICLGISKKKEIANFLSIIHEKNIRPDTTVHDAFRRLYAKLSCNNPTQLIKMAINYNLHLQPPHTMLKKGTFIISD